MAIEDLKRWQWCVIGCVVGAVAGSAYLYSLPHDKVGTQHVGPRVFEEQLVDGRDPTGRRVWKLQNLEIHPPSSMPVPGQRSAEKPYISYDALLVRKDNPKLADRVPHNLILEIRTPRDKSLAGKLDGLTVQEYLDKVNAAIGKLDKKRYARVKPVEYKYQWIETPKGAFPIYTLGGFLVIGLIWPTVVQMLVGHGFGRVKSEEELALSKYKPSKTQVKAGKAPPTQAEVDQLAQLEAELEAKLRSGETAASAVTSAKPIKETVKVLNAGPLEPAREAPREASKPKGFGADAGDYYPTEVHGKSS
jgi:hypothetical protein